MLQVQKRHTTSIKPSKHCVFDTSVINNANGFILSGWSITFLWEFCGVLLPHDTTVDETFLCNSLVWDQLGVAPLYTHDGHVQIHIGLQTTGDMQTGSLQHSAPLWDLSSLQLWHYWHFQGPKLKGRIPFKAVFREAFKAICKEACLTNHICIWVVALNSLMHVSNVKSACDTCMRELHVRVTAHSHKY